MAEFLTVANPGPWFFGHPTIFQFVNADGQNSASACGQAAIATVLANHSKIPMSLAGLRMVEKSHPANVVSGVLGTSPAQIRRALKDYNLECRYVDGQKGLEDAMRRRRVAIVLIQKAAGLRGIGQGAHWLVVFGCDPHGVHVTNYSGHIDWLKFHKLWTAPIPKVAGMSDRVICC